MMSTNRIALAALALASHTGRVAGMNCTGDPTACGSQCHLELSRAHPGHRDGRLTHVGTNAGLPSCSSCTCTACPGDTTMPHPAHTLHLSAACSGLSSGPLAWPTSVTVSAPTKLVVGHDVTLWGPCPLLRLGPGVALADVTFNCTNDAPALDLLGPDTSVTRAHVPQGRALALAGGAAGVDLSGGRFVNCTGIARLVLFRGKVPMSCADDTFVYVVKEQAGGEVISDGCEGVSLGVITGIAGATATLEFLEKNAEYDDTGMMLRRITHLCLAAFLVTLAYVLTQNVDVFDLDQLKAKQE